MHKGLLKRSLLNAHASHKRICIFTYMGHAGGNCQLLAASVALLPRSLLVFSDEAYIGCLHSIAEVHDQHKQIHILDCLKSTRHLKLQSFIVMRSAFPSSLDGCKVVSSFAFVGAQHCALQSVSEVRPSCQCTYGTGIFHA